MSTRHTIKLVNQDGWMAVHSDPEVKELFGTPIIPTSFTHEATADMVLREIQALNPECDVTVQA